jgi:hypothetical protein
MIYTTCLTRGLQVLLHTRWAFGDEVGEATSTTSSYRPSSDHDMTIGASPDV